MKRYALFVAFGLALYDCNYFGPDLQCRGTIIDNQELDFEGACTGDNCSLMTLGSTESVPSLLPGDHALALDAAASATWTLGIAGNGEGTSIAMSFRCDEGGSLLLGAQGAGGVAMNVGATADWQRRVWPIAEATTSFETLALASAGRHQAVIWVSNSGHARCVIDWLRFVAAPRVCGNSRACGTSFRDPRTFCNGSCADTVNDRQNCGGCGRTCATSQYCENSECRPESCRFCPRGTSCTASGTCSNGDAGSAFDVPERDIFHDVVSRDATDPTQVVAGRRCTDDSNCRSPSADLRCTATVGGRVCSVPTGCAQGSTSAEQAQCGGVSSTCLLFGDFAQSSSTNHCTRACNPSAFTEAAGGCSSGAVCTSNWVGYGSPTDVRGCLPLCHDDADCVGGAVGDAGASDAGTPTCNRRTGRCIASARTDLAGADGTPCNPMLVRSSGDDPCRGMCRLLNTANPTQGLCASVVDLHTATCDDTRIDPTMLPDDNLALCMSARCTRNDECPTGLRCVFPERGTPPDRILDRELPTCGYATDLQPNGIPGAGGPAMDAGMD